MPVLFLLLNVDTIWKEGLSLWNAWLGRLCSISCLLCVYAQSLSGVVTLSIPWTVLCQAPLSLEFSRQEYWSPLPFPSPGDLPDPGIKPRSLVSPELVGRCFTTVPLEALHVYQRKSSQDCYHASYGIFVQIPFHKFQVTLFLLYLGSTVSIDSDSDQGTLWHFKLVCRMLIFFFPVVFRIYKVVIFTL